jgi:hypothetical protein
MRVGPHHGTRRPVHARRLVHRDCSVRAAAYGFSAQLIIQLMPNLSANEPK